MKSKKELIEVPFQKLNDEDFDFQILDMKKLLKVTTIYEHLEEDHRINFNTVFIIFEGEGIHNIDFKSYSYQKGTCFFIAKGQVVSFVLNKNMNCYILEFTDDFFNVLLKSNVYDMFDYMRYSPCIQLDEEALKSVIKNIELLNYQSKVRSDEFKEHIIKSSFQCLLFQLKRERVKNVIQIKTSDEKTYNEFIHLSRSSHKYTMKVEDYARALDISSKTLTRIINKYLNKPTKVYLNELLLLEIKRYLLDEGLTLEKIANKLEFDEITNLIKFFKKSSGLTPAEFKDRYKKQK